MAPEFLDRVNGAFGDSLVLVARALGGRAEATTAQAVGLDPVGIELVVAGPERAEGEAVRVDFANPLTDPMELGASLLALVQRARTVSGEPGTTSAEREAARMAGVRTFLTTVRRVETIHDGLRLVTFAGGDLATFEPLGPDTFLYVLLPPPGRSELTIDTTFTRERWRTMPAEDRPVGAYYTVRSWRPERAELDMLFVIHEPAGPASAWAARARPGDPVALWGPREGFEPPAGTAWYLLVADDAGLPAVAAILEALPPGPPVLVVGEVDDPACQPELTTRHGVVVRWAHRRGRAPGTVADVVLEAVRATQVPDGPGYVWAGAEAATVTALRRHAVDELGLGGEQLSLVAYWRRADPASAGAAG
jgi:NADPH-dependent ferric siderophore reductase